MLTHTVTLQRGGATIRTASVPSRAAGIVGDWFEGVPYQPSLDDVAKAVPYRYRKAVHRAVSWWQTTSYSGRAIPLRMDLRDWRDRPMGTLFATPNWPAGV